MVPSLDELPLFCEDLDPVGQNAPFQTLAREIEGCSIPPPFHLEFNRLFFMVPKKDFDPHTKLPFEQAARKIPSDEEPLPFRRVFLPRIGGPYMGTREKIPVDPLLLHIEMVSIAARKKSQKKPTSDYASRHG